MVLNAQLVHQFVPLVSVNQFVLHVSQVIHCLLLLRKVLAWHALVLVKLVLELQLTVLPV